MWRLPAGRFRSAKRMRCWAPISYDADVTWNENTYATKRDNLANLLFNVIVLCGVVIGLALVVGVGFGGCESC